jgi:predicted nucleotide-binding protein
LSTGGQRLVDTATKLAADGTPSPVHLALAEFSPSAIVTTNYDSLIEDAIRLLGNKAAVIVPGESTEPIADDATPVFKVFGTPENPSTLTANVSESLLGPVEESYSTLLLRTMMTVNVVIVIGFDLGSNELGQLYERFGEAPRSSWFIVTDQTNPVSESLWASRGVHVINVASADLSYFFEELKSKRDALAEAPKPTKQRHQIFVRHTGDEATAATVRRLLRTMNLKPVGAEDASGSSQTWMERLEDLAGSSDAAIVILGPESSGGRAGETARSNVIFELGLLLGTLGRDRVLTLVTRDAIPPTDLGGFEYLAFDSTRDDVLAGELNRWARRLNLVDSG